MAQNNDQMMAGSGGAPMPQFAGEWGGQHPGLGRYRPPTLMGDGSDPNKWNDSGGYRYNLPNAFGPTPGFSQFGMNNGVPLPYFNQSSSLFGPFAGMAGGGGFNPGAGMFGHGGVRQNPQQGGGMMFGTLGGTGYGPNPLGSAGPGGDARRMNDMMRQLQWMGVDPNNLDPRAIANNPQGFQRYFDTIMAGGPSGPSPTFPMNTGGDMETKPTMVGAKPLPIIQGQPIGMGGKPGVSPGMLPQGPMISDPGPQRPSIEELRNQYGFRNEGSGGGMMPPLPRGSWFGG